MLFRDVVFAAVLFALCLSGNAHTQNWVKQWPGDVHATPGENITIHCQINVEIQGSISKCFIEWYAKNEDGTYPAVDKLPQFSGRHCERRNESHWSTSLALSSLELNDTGMFYCNYFCNINGTYWQHYGTGTRLFVHLGIYKENVTLDHQICTSNITDGVDGESRVYLLYRLLVFTVLLFKSVILILMCSVALFSPL